MDIKDNPMLVPNISVVNDLGGVSSKCIEFFGKIRYGQNNCLIRPFNHARGWRPAGKLPNYVCNSIFSFST